MTNEAVNNDVGAAKQLSQLPSQAVKLSNTKSSITLNADSAAVPIPSPKATPSGASTSPQQATGN
jgi:hypothetical protein